MRGYVELKCLLDDGQELEEDPKLVESCNVALTGSKCVATALPRERRCELKLEPRLEDLPVASAALKQGTLKREPVRS